MQNPKLRYFKLFGLDHTGFGLPESVVAHNAPGNVEEPVILANYRAASGGYFSTMRIPLVRGRLLTDNDRGRRLVTLSQSLAEKLWPGGDPIGKRCIAGWGELQIQPSEVVGVVGDIRTAKLDQPPLNMVYVPDSWGPKGSRRSHPCFDCREQWDRLQRHRFQRS